MLQYIKKALRAIGLIEENREIVDSDHNNVWNVMSNTIRKSYDRRFKWFQVGFNAVMLGVSLVCGISHCALIFALFLAYDGLDLAYDYRDERQMVNEVKSTVVQAA